MRTIEDICVDIGMVEGLRFRTWTVEDADTLVAAWSDPEIARWNPVPPEPTIELAEHWIRSTETQNEASVGIDIVAERSNTLIGEIGLQIDPAQAVGEVGFWVGADHRRHGSGQAMLAFAQALATQLDLVGLVALVDSQNALAIALLNSVGWSEIPTKSDRRAFAYRTPAPQDG